MTKPEATKEARLGALMQGGNWYVVRKGNAYLAMHCDQYRGSEDGTLLAIFWPDKVRRTTPPTVRTK